MQQHSVILSPESFGRLQNTENKKKHKETIQIARKQIFSWYEKVFTNHCKETRSKYIVFFFDDYDQRGKKK
jgi:hypothetical protein